MHSPLEIFHTLHILSPEADTSSCSEGANYMSQIPLRCPLRVLSSWSEFACHKLMVLSCELVATILSLGDILTAFIYFWCAMMVMLAEFTVYSSSILMSLPSPYLCIAATSGVFHNLSVLSWLTVAKNLFFLGAKQTPEMFSLWP